MNTGAPSIGYHGGMAARRIAIGSIPTTEGRFPIWKRTLDITAVLLTLPVWLPMMVLIAIAIKITSPGCILFRQERVGFRGERFTLLKFRSMKQDAGTGTHEGYLDSLIRTDCPMTKLDACGDPRILPLGRLLRASGLDELPQICNVLRGDMSLVGPRPCTAHEYEFHSERQRERFNAPPGLTGYWQVNGKNRTTFSQMVAMDIYYSSRMSLGMDLLIILQTVPAIVRQVRESLRSGNRPISGVTTPAANGN